MENGNIKKFKQMTNKIKVNTTHRHMHRYACSRTQTDYTVPAADHNQKKCEVIFDFLNLAAYSRKV